MIENDGLNRRQVLGAGAALLATGLSLAEVRASFARTMGRVVVVGGGFAGAACARALKSVAPNLEVTLVEVNMTYVACPFSNEVVVGSRTISQQYFSYDKIQALGIKVRIARAVAVEESSIILDDGTKLPFDRAVLAPGIDLNFDAIPGYDETAIERLPHAWKAGPQTELLHRQLQAMPDGGVVVMIIPANPYRCPPGPYERASLIAHFLKMQKPRSKIILLDSKDSFSKQKLFSQAWAEFYPDHLEWVGLSGGGKVASVDVRDMSVKTDFAQFQADVINVIPPQRAGRLAAAAGATDQSHWCPIDPTQFESKLRPGIHVLGDAAIMGAMPKSAFAANMQAKACAYVIAALMNGDRVPELQLINTCYSMIGYDQAISIAGVYRPADGVLADVPGAGGTSPLDAGADFRRMEAELARGWFSTICDDVFG